jgi:S1-C subfamily serine protease
VRVRLVVLVGLAAAAGAAASLAVVRATGWLAATTTQVRVLSEAAPVPQPAAVRGRPLVPDRFDPAAIYARRAAGVVTIFAQFAGGANAQGSGFVVARDGTILTNSHVITNAGEADPARVRGAESVFVEFGDRDRVPARIVGWDLFDDVGVIRVEPSAHALQPLPLGDSGGVVVGEPVAAIGSPLGDESSLAVGVVSATGRSIRSLTSGYDLVDAIQIDAAINHGNSGGPLFDARGNVIGINAQIRRGAPGVGFAVPIGSARRSLEQLVTTGHVRYAYVGVSAQDLTPSVARRFGVHAQHGAAVSSIVPGSPADRAGLRAGTAVSVEGATYPRGGDVVVAIEGRAVRSADDLLRSVTQRLRPGRAVRFTIVRGGRRLTVAVTPVERPVSPHSGR